MTYEEINGVWPAQSATKVSLEAARNLRAGRLFHVPPAASPVSTRIHLVLEAPVGALPEAVVTDSRREQGWRIALERAADGLWHTSLLLPQKPTVLRYHFVLADGTKILERRQQEGSNDPLYGVWTEKEFQLAVYQPQGAPPDWIAGQVVYQIFPDRFAQADPTSLSKGSDMSYSFPILRKQWHELPENPPKGRDFFGGDLQGVISKLDYIKDLGITCIYFTPIFESPTNHRYDAINYFKIDPRLGTEDDLRELIEKARARGIRVMLDAVFNHCSMESDYFRSAQASKLSPYYRWFTFMEWPEIWYAWYAVKEMPEFVECPEVEEFFFGKNGVALHWLSYGTAGWRTDVTFCITDEYWRRFRAAVRSAYPDAYLIAEDWEDMSHRLLGDSYDAAMNYRFNNSVGGWAAGKISPAELDDRLETLRRDTPLPQFHTQLNLIGSHDTIRLLTKLGGSKERVKLAASLQLSYPGVPMIYYGDEAGIEGEFAEDGRRPYPWDAPDRELLAFYHKAIHERRASKALSLGNVSTVYISDAGYGFLRCYEEDRVLALFNASPHPLEMNLSIAAELAAGTWTDLLGTVLEMGPTSGGLEVKLPALSAAWLRRSR